MSNRFVTNDMKAKEIVALLHDGVRVTVNSDDPAYFGGYMNENFAALAAGRAGLSPAEVVQLARNAFEIAWLDRRRATLPRRARRLRAAHGVDPGS